MKTRKYFFNLMFAVIWLFLPSAVFSAVGEGSAQLNVKPQIPLPFVKTNPAGEIEKLDDYVQGVYRLVIGLAAIFAVVMMIIAGYQWMLAGGGERTAAAKKRIFGAAIGLMLALLSYVILNAVTPELVKLHLREVKPVPSIFASLSENSCQYNPNLQQLATNRGVDLGSLQVAPVLGPNKKGGDVNLSDARCGQLYESADGKAQVQCYGAKCSNPDEFCIDSKYCRPTFLYGNVAWGIAAGDINDLFSKSYVDRIKIYSVCRFPDGIAEGDSVDDNFIVQEQLDLDLDEATRFYTFPLLEGETKDELFHSLNCRITKPPPGILGTFLESVGIVGQALEDVVEIDADGFVLGVEVNDDKTFFWPTIDDEFAMGKSCQKPLRDSRNHMGVKDINWAQAGNLLNVLFQKSDFQRGARCDLNITQNNFPPQ